LRIVRDLREAEDRLFKARVEAVDEQQDAVLLDRGDPLVKALEGGVPVDLFRREGREFLRWIGGKALGPLDLSDRARCIGRDRNRLSA
jgi:hypothetical protein